MTIGDVVEWTSQAGGSTRTKRGAIEAVVPAFERPAAMSKNRNPGAPRNHESYLVRVRGSRGGLYWPRASSLRPAPAASPQDDREGEP